MVKRIFWLVLDGFGIGAAPDSAAFGDAGCHTLRSVLATGRLSVPTMHRLGLFNIEGSGAPELAVSQPLAAFGRMREASAGKDTTIGHWELAGLISPRPMPTYPDGFPQELIDRFAALTGRGVLCNRPYSGTQVIADYGPEQAATGQWIVYTSADSVFQIAAHEEIIPLEELFRACRIARELLTGEHAVGRVIARPYLGTPGQYTRTRNRHDFSLPPPRDTLLDVLSRAGRDVISVGKINDIFAGRGITRVIPGAGNPAGLQATAALQQEDFNGLCFVNLVDFDMLYGHRNDAAGYADALGECDRFLSEFLPRMRPEDVLILTADHGCDPGFPGTDHTREYVPLLVCGAEIAARDLGTRPTFADLGRSVAALLGVPAQLDGQAFL